MKRILLLCLMLQSSIFATECLCTSNLDDAFDDIEEYVFDDNVDKMIDALKKSNDLLDENIETFKDLEKEYKIYVKLFFIDVEKVTQLTFKERSLRKIEK